MFRSGVVQAIWRRCLSKKVKQTQEPAAYLAFRQQGESRKRNLYNGSVGNPGTPTRIQISVLGQASIHPSIRPVGNFHMP